MSGGYITIGVNEIGLIPIADKNSFLVQIIVQKADTILERLQENETADVSDLETEIDILVYHLYNLTYDEVLIIDPNTPITREIYERTK